MVQSMPYRTTLIYIMSLMLIFKITSLYKLNKMKQHFFMPYFGNKRQEVKQIYNYIQDDLKTKNIIVEPFCGSSALSFYISTLHPQKYKYILNDNNMHLIEIYKILEDEERAEKFYTDLDLISENMTKDKYKEIVKDAKNNPVKWFYINKVYNIRPGLFPQGKTILKEFKKNIESYDIINFLRSEDIEFYNEDAKDILLKYGNNSNCIIFLDPPYLSACNDFYKNKDVNIYQYLYHNNIKTFNAPIVLVLEDIWIIRLLFNNDIKHSYAKTYETNKKKTSHIIIKNKVILNTE